ncbi:MAG: arsenate reductase family protein [Flavobacteriales bacterium]
MRKIFHLANCSTCQRIIKELDLENHNFEFQNIKEQNVNEQELDVMKEVAGSYESLFSRRAMKFRSMGLGEKELSEEDYRALILEEYTFLKRPVIWIDGELFVGSAKNNIAKAKEQLG